MLSSRCYLKKLYDSNFRPDLILKTGAKIESSLPFYTQESSYIMTNHFDISSRIQYHVSPYPNHIFARVRKPMHDINGQPQKHKHKLSFIRETIAVMSWWMGWVINVIETVSYPFVPIIHSKYKPCISLFDGFYLYNPNRRTFLFRWIYLHSKYNPHRRTA